MTLTRIDSRRLVPGFLAAVLASTAVNLVLLLLCKRGFDLTPALVDAASGHVEVMGVRSVVGASAVSALAATIVLAVLARFTRAPVRAFYLVAGGALVLSMIPVVLAPVDAGSTRIVMGAMHIAAALAIVGALVAVARSAR